MKRTFREENNDQHIALLLMSVVNCVFSGIIIILLTF